MLQQISRWVVLSGMWAFILLSGSAAAAQTNASSTDIQRLQDDVYQAGADLSRLRGTHASQASQLQQELDELREEVIYLKVKLRKEGSVRWSEYADVRDRIQNLRTRARGESTTPWQGGTPTGGAVDTPQRQSDRPAREARASAIPVGQEIDVRLQSTLSSDTAEVEQRFEATTLVDLYRGNDVLIPAGSVLRGVVSSVKPATRTSRRGEITLSFDRVTVRGQDYPMRGTVVEALKSEGIRAEAGRIGAGSAIGAIIGGIVGGVKGALLGVVIAGGATVAATEGTDVTLPAGTVLRIRLDTPPEIR